MLWLVIKDRSCLIQCQIIVKFVRKILYLSVNADGSLFQVVVRTGLTVFVDILLSKDAELDSKLEGQNFDFPLTPTCSP